MQPGPAEVDDLTPAAPGEQQKADDVGLLPAALPAVSIQNDMETVEFLPGQEPGGFRAPVEFDAPGGIACDMTAGDGEVEDLPKTGEGVIGIARSGAAVSVEPAPDPGLPDAVERLRAESGQKLARQLIANAPFRRRFVAVEMGFLPRPRDEVPKQGNRRRRGGLFPGPRFGPAGMAFPANLLDALRRRDREKHASSARRCPATAHSSARRTGAPGRQGLRRGCPRPCIRARGGGAGRWHHR